VGGCSLDAVYEFSNSGPGGLWVPEDLVTIQGHVLPGIQLGHNGTGVGLSVVPPVGNVPVNAQVYVHPCAAGVALSKTGQTMVVTNYFNDSISVLNGGHGHWPAANVPPGNFAVVPNVDLRPGKSTASASSGTPGGEYPFWVVVAGSEPNAVAYVSSIRDREIDVVPLSSTGGPMQVTARIPVKGQPNKMVMNQAQTLLYVAEDQTDTVDVIDINPDPTHNLTFNTVIETIPVLAPAGLLPSAFYYSGRTATSRTPSTPGRTRTASRFRKTKRNCT